MRYGITKASLGSQDFIELTPERYNSIKNARNALLEISFIEEKFDLVVENFFEYEQTLLLLAGWDLVFRDFDHQRAHRHRRLINRRLANLLSGCRLYQDQALHHLSRTYGENSDQVVEVRTAMRGQYDALLGYRMMEALRNYVQHRGWAIHSVSYSRHPTGAGVSFSFVPFVNLERLSEDEKFKPEVLDEMKAIAD